MECPYRWAASPDLSTISNGKRLERERGLIGKMLRTSPILSLAEEYLTGRVTSVELTVKRREGVSEEACEASEMWLGIGKHRDGGGRLGDMTTDDLIRHLMSAKAYGNVAMSECWSFDPGAELYFCPCIDASRSPTIPT